MTIRARYPRMYWYNMTTTLPMLTAIIPREDTNALVIRNITEMERIVNQVRWQALYQLGRFLKSYVSRQYRLICAKSRQFIWPLSYDGQELYSSISSYTSLERQKNTLSKKIYFGRRKPIIFRYKKIKKHILHENFLKFLKNVI